MLFRSMSITLNGVLIAVPLNGQAYEIPESFAEIFNTRIRAIDKMEMKQGILADIAQNHEAAPGELDLM